MVPFVQSKKHEKLPLWGVIFSKVNKSNTFNRLKHAILLKVTLHGCFSHFINFTNGTKSHKTSYTFVQNTLNQVTRKFSSFRPRPNRWTNLEHLETKKKKGPNKFEASKDLLSVTNNVNIMISPCLHLIVSSLYDHYMIIIWLYYMIIIILLLLLLLLLWLLLLLYYYYYYYYYYDYYYYYYYIIIIIIMIIIWLYDHYMIHYMIKLYLHYMI